MAAVAEAQARLNIALNDIVEFYRNEKLPDDSIAVLIDYIDKHLTTEFLMLAESYSNCMAFINHDELISRLYTAWTAFLEGFNVERRLALKRIQILKDGKKKDPNAILNFENLIKQIDKKRSEVSWSTLRLKAMKSIPIEKFINNPDFDYQNEYKVIAESERIKFTIKKTIIEQKSSNK